MLDFRSRTSRQIQHDVEESSQLFVKFRSYEFDIL